MPSLLTTITPFGNGVDPTAGQGETKRLTITGTWVAGEEITLLLIDQTTGVSFTVGAGDVTALSPVFGLTLDQKSYFIANASFYFSDIDSPTVFNEPTNPGNGNVNVANYFNTPENLTALAQYQNGLAVFSPNFIQVWEVNADPANYAKKQTLQNVGTRAKETVRSLGYLDVIFLDDSGFRSLRTRDVQLDAETIDVGSPIDELVQAAIDAGVSVPAACGIVEPRTKMYWGFLGGVIYVLSRFQASKITAWSTFTPSHHTGMVPAGAVFDGSGNYTVTDLMIGYTYTWTREGSTTLTNGSQVFTTSSSFVATATTAVISGGTPAGLVGLTGSPVVGQKLLTIELFRVKDRQVFFRATDGYLYSYGGANGATYDKIQVVVETPWLDDGSPTANKLNLGVDASFAGLWTFSFGMDPETGTLAQVWDWTGSTDQNVASTFDKKTITTADFQGTHFKLRGVSSATSTAKCLLSSLHLKYKLLETT